jgi:hypothetical protein
MAAWRTVRQQGLYGGSGQWRGGGGIMESRALLEREGKHPIVEVDGPREEPLQLGETVARWRDRLRAIMQEDDAAERIARATDSTLGVIGGPGDVIGGGRRVGCQQCLPPSDPNPGLCG